MRQRTTITLGILMALCLLGAGAVSGNGITVSNVAAVDHDAANQHLRVMFDLSGSNTWRNARNHDAAWVFVKYRAPGMDEWAHARLSSESGDHVPGGNSVIDATADGMGVFLYSSIEHDGAVHYAKNRLLWPYGESGLVIADADAVEFSVHAIAMVYVPEGAFEVGSGGTESGSLTDGAWTEQGGTGRTIPFRITGDPIAMGPSANKLWGTKGEAGGRGGHAGVGAAGALPAAFPTGYEAFYGMKHPLTQGQYADFLNLLPPEQAAERFSNPWRRLRYSIRRDGEAFVAQAPERACNYLSWADGALFAAWSGLRPMTELEFEKACRGAAPPVAGEYAWGTTRITPQRGHYGDDGSGTELATLDRRGKTLGGNCNVDSGIRGPVRVGIYADTARARDDMTRENAGASYWGILQLSGNLWERTVAIRGKGLNFAGTHGDGTLTLPADWPGIDADGAGVRGGYWRYSLKYARVSDRTYAADAVPQRGRSPYHGWRGVRTAPAGLPAAPRVAAQAEGAP